MKIFLIITTVLILKFSALASDSNLVFRPVSFAQVFELAKKEGKAVLLYFHFEGCGACLKMEKTSFLDPKVARFYNSNFVCLDVNIKKGEGIETNKIYNIQMAPTFLFLDEKGNALHKIVGIFSPEDFVLQGQNTLNPSQTLSHFKQKYQAGQRDADFLFEYCYKLKDAHELDSLVINEYLNAQKDLSTEDNIKFLYEFAIYKHKNSFSYKHKAYTFMSSNTTLFTPYFDLEQVNTRLMFIVLEDVYKAIKAKDTVAFHKAIELLKAYDHDKLYNFKAMDGGITMSITGGSLVLSAEIFFYDEIGDLQKYNAALKQYILLIWDDYDALNTLAWDFYSNYDDKLKLEKATECVIRSIALNSNYANNDTYASLLYKLAQYEQAITQAEKAIDLAQKENIDYKETSELIEKIKAKQKK